MLAQGTHSGCQVLRGHEALEREESSGPPPPREAPRVLRAEKNRRDGTGSHLLSFSLGFCLSTPSSLSLTPNLLRLRALAILSSRGTEVRRGKKSRKSPAVLSARLPGPTPHAGGLDSTPRYYREGLLGWPNRVLWKAVSPQKCHAALAARTLPPPFANHGTSAAPPTPR